MKNLIFFKSKRNSVKEKPEEQIETINYGKWCEDNIPKHLNIKVSLMILNEKFAGKTVSIKNFINDQKFKIDYVDVIVKHEGSNQYLLTFRFKEIGDNDHFVPPSWDDEITIYPVKRLYTKEDPYGEEDWIEQ